MPRKMFLCLLMLLSVYAAHAQETVQVVTKIIEKTFSYRDGYEVNVEGEKAEINVETWSKPEISVRLEITAKHPKLATAEEDLNTLKFVAERVKNKIYLRNYRYGGSEQAASVMTIRYIIILPETCPVYVRNYFGTANISNLSNRLRIFGEFSQIDIDNVQGLIDIRTRFGDIVGDKLDGNVTINARRSDITLRDFGGQFQINAQYGTLKLFPNEGLLGLNVSADKSEVHLYESAPRRYGYTLTATHGNVSTPSDMRLISLEDTPEVRRVQFKPSKQEGYATITISVTFGDVYVEKPSTKERF